MTGVHSRIANAMRLAAPPAGLGLAVFVLLRFPPARYSFYPQCPIHELLHLQCPGCGGTRAIAALLRGQFTQAMHFNALVTLLLPVAAIYGILCYSRFAQRRTLSWPHPPSIAIYAMFGLIVIFTAIRNL